MKFDRNMAIAAALIAGGGISTAVFIGHDANKPLLPQPASHAAGNQLTVIELFTSQACISCPPAEAFLTELVQARDDILGLEFHVTYWDDFVDGERGRWKDIFADPAYTERQTQYNLRLRAGQGPYTPQMVIGGQFQAVGFSRDEVLAAIDVASAGASTPPPTISVSTTGQTISIAIEKTGESTTDAGNIWLIRYDLAHATNITSGENQGRALVNRNVVTDMQLLGSWTGGSTQLNNMAFSALGPGEACAIILQGHENGRIYAAARCPS